MAAKMNEIKVSVVCPVYNRADYIRHTIDSLLAQEFDAFEVVVVNDGSTDPRVKEILDSYDDLRLRVVHQENTGFTVAIRRAIQMTSGPFIAIQGAGDISLPDRLRLQWEAMQADTEVAIVGCGYRIHDLADGALSEVIPTQVPRRGKFKGFGFSHGELMYRREVYDLVGGYRDLFAVGQGSDLWMRLLRDHEALILPKVLYEQRLFVDGVAKSYKKLTARAILSAIRVENERLFRKSGVDYIDEFGVSAMSILAARPRVKWRIALARSKLLIDSRWKDVHLFPAGITITLLSHICLILRLLLTRHVGR